MLSLQHPAIDTQFLLSVFRRRPMCHTTTLLATMELYVLVAPYIGLRYLAFNLDFISFVVRPKRSVAATDRALTFVEMFVWWWKGDADGFAVASCRKRSFL